MRSSAAYVAVCGVNSVVQRTSFTKRGLCDTTRRIHSYGRILTWHAHHCAHTMSMETRPKRTILLTNDDGIDPESCLVVKLASALANHGLDVTVCAPGRNNSACGHAITLSNNLTMRRHRKYENEYGVKNGQNGVLRLFSVEEGTPADCVAAAIEPRNGVLAKLGLEPLLVVSGVNLGPNMGTDIVYSGTFAGARQAAMYGVPAIAASLADEHLSQSNPQRASNCDRAVAATVQLVHAVLAALQNDVPDIDVYKNMLNNIASKNGNITIQHKLQLIHHAFARGDLLLNINIPPGWSHAFAPTALDGVMYRDVVRLPALPAESNEEVKFRFGEGHVEIVAASCSDSDAIKSGKTAISTVQTWPWSHPMFVPTDVLHDAAFLPDKNGIPLWITQHATVKAQI